MTEFNTDCRLRLREIRCASGSPCAGFDHEWFGAAWMYPRYDGGGYVLVYPVSAERELVEEAA